MIERAPHWAAAWVALGVAAERAGDPAEAVWAYREAVTLDAGGTLGASLHLARLQGDRALKAMPPAYVAALFDDYAPRFDRHLVGTLGYVGPAVLLDALRAAGAPQRWRHALDLGCGTGLMGRAIRAQVQRLEGVDLSPRMVAEAARTGLYDALACGDIEEVLAGRAAGELDLMLAADVLVYCGALETIFAAAARALAAGGQLAFTVQAGEASFRLGDDLRFSHSGPYLRQTLDGAGLSILALEPVCTRREAGAAVPGLAVVARKP